MRLFPSDRYPLPLPPDHRFPAAKYALLRRRLERLAIAGAPFEFIEPHAATDDELLRVHDRGYVGRVLAGALAPQEVRRIGFPWSPQLVERSLRSTGAAVDAALDGGRVADPAAVRAGLGAFLQAFIDPTGLDGRPWFRSLIAASDRDDGYAPCMLPLVAEAVRDRDLPRVARGVQRMLSAQRRAIDAIDAIESGLAAGKP